MVKSLLEQLPGIIASGRKEADRILGGIDRPHRMTLQTREIVLPARGPVAHDPDLVQNRAAPWTNRIIQGDSLLAMGALLSGDETTPSLRGKVDLIYFDPPLGSKADDRTSRFAPSGTSHDETVLYLAMMTPRLMLMRELLAETGSIYVHLHGHARHYVKLLLDEVFGRDNFAGELIWKRQTAHRDVPGPSGPTSSNTDCPVLHDTLLYFGKSQARYCGLQYRPLSKKLYLPQTKSVAVESVWTDVHPAPTCDKAERVNHDTHKPEKLLERIIRASCPEAGLIADFTGSSGTTAAVAEKSGRRWITTDPAKPACMIMRTRLIDQDAKPFLYQTIGQPQAKAARGRDFRIGDLSDIVLSLYGALPLPPAVNPQRNLGWMPGKLTSANRRSKTLVLADSPNKLTGASTLRKAIAQRDGLMGGWDKAVVLGWSFEPAMGETITALNDSRLEVLAIPPELMDRLQKKDGLDTLRGQLRLASLQFLTICPIECRPEGERETLTVRLKNYVLLSPGAIKLDDASRARLQEVIDKEPLALIDYWAVDPDYDGKVFRSLWQDYRGNTARDHDDFRVTTQAVVTTGAKAGPRKVCVRAVDVFGFEAEVVATVAELPDFASPGPARRLATVATALGKQPSQ